MNRKRLCHTPTLGFILLCAVVGLFDQTVIGAAAQINWDDWDVIPGTVLIKYKPERAKALRANRAAHNVRGLALGRLEERVETATTAKQLGKAFESLLPDHFVGKFNRAERDRVLKALEADPDVVYFEPDRVRVAKSTWGTATPNDPNINILWGMQRIHAPEVWALQSAARSSIRVAVMEDRYDSGHRDLSAQNSAVQNNSKPIGEHPTHVAGTIAATGNNGTDVAGVANVELVALEIGSRASGFASQVTWAMNNQVRVINMSWKWCGNDGQPTPCDRCIYAAPSQTEQDAITAALDSIVFVAAAGNDACQTDSNGRAPLPASYTGVIGVSALTRGDTLASFSNFGPYVDLTAPGEGIWSTIPGNRTGVMQGTSMAAPHVAGAAAAVLVVANLQHMQRPTVHKEYDTRSIPRLLALTAEDLGDLGYDTHFGNGVVRVDRAVAAIADVYAEQSVASCRNIDVRDEKTGWSTEWCGFLVSNWELGWCRQHVDPLTSTAWSDGLEDRYVDFFKHQCQLSVHCVLPAGTLDVPYCDLATAVEQVPQGGTIGLVRGQPFHTPITITKPATFIAIGGTVSIGQ